jgi:hypothetical protein
MKHPSVEKHKQYLRDKFMDEAITRLGAAEGCAYVNQGEASAGGRTCFARRRVAN